MPSLRLLDRTDELKRLAGAWTLARRGQAQLVVLWGRRRVGKTFLLSHFVGGKRAVFFGATQQAETVELARLAEAVRRDLGDREADLAGGAFNGWEAALRFFAALATSKPLIVVLDEVPYLFLPRLDPAGYLEAYAACGGYPLHLLAWDQSASTEQNLERLGGSAGGILLEDAASIMSDELAEARGYARILAAIGRGRTRYAEIAGEAGQRVEYPLEVLARSGFVAKVGPVGAPRASRTIYMITDPYLAFWFRVLYSDLALIHGGQGRAVLQRARPRWHSHLGQVFEDVARAHAQRLVATGELPADLVIGRWWAVTGEPCEVDVLGLRGSRTALLGEAKWQAHPLDTRDLEALRRKTPRTPEPIDAPLYLLWGRAGITADVRRAGAQGFDAKAMLQ